MATATHHVLTLELEFVGVDDVNGRLSDLSGTSRDFVGWLGLACAIEALAGTATTTADVAPPPRRNP